MEITREQTGKLTADIRVRIDPADYKPQVDAELKKQAKKASLPGFRPGKVPIGMIRRMVGKSLVIETVQEVVNEALNDYLETENLAIMGRPLAKEEKTEDDFPADANSSIEFDFLIGLAPEVALDYDLPVLPVRYEIDVDDAFLDKEIDTYRERFGGVTNPDEVAEGDIFYGKIFEADEEGNPKEEGVNQMVPFNPLRIENADFFPPYFGATVDSVHPLDLKQISDDQELLAKLLFMDEGDAMELKEKSLVVEIKRINRLGHAELNEEFFQKVAEDRGWDFATEEEDESSVTEGEDIEDAVEAAGIEEAEEIVEENGEKISEEESQEEEVSSSRPDFLTDVSAFQEKIRAELAESLSENARWDYLSNLREALIDHHPLEFPDDFLKELIQKSEKEKDAAEIEVEYPLFLKDQTWSLVVAKIIEQNKDLEVGHEELLEHMKRDLRAMLGGMPMTQEQEMEYLQIMTQNQETVSNTYNRLVSERVMLHLEEKIPTTTKESITATAFMEMKEKEKAEKEAEAAAQPEADESSAE